jgi:hypothetical protein
MSNAKTTSSKKATPDNSTQESSIEEKTVIYVGPPLRKLATFAVFRGNLPQYLNQELERIPEMRSLFLPVKDFSSRQAEVNDPTNILYSAYQTVQSKIERGE